MYKDNRNAIGESIEKSTHKEIRGSHDKDFDEWHGFEIDNDKETDENACPEAVRSIQTPLDRLWEANKGAMCLQRGSWQLERTD
jgi:hypothetical protein